MTSNGANDFLFEACERGDLALIQQHVHSLSPLEIADICDGHKVSLVHYACRHGHLDILDYLIRQKHVDISQIRTEHGGTCAHEAAVSDRKNILHYIFHYHTSDQDPQQCQKLRWHVRDNQGHSPLHLAAAYGSLNTLDYLLNVEFADAHMRSYNGFQPLHCAVASSHIECVRILLNAARDTINAQTNTSVTPLYLACQHGSLEMVQLLLAYGANPKIKDANGLNCLHAACQSSHLDIMRWLIEKHSTNVNDLDYSDNTLLHYAAANGNETIITYLLEKNTRSSLDSNGNTPLHVAAKNGQQNACILLIETGGCSVDAMNSQNLTPADIADEAGYSALANELRRRVEALTSLPMVVNGILLEKTNIGRLVVKRENVTPSDNSTQVSEDLLKNRKINDGDKVIYPTDRRPRTTSNYSIGSLDEHSGTNLFVNKLSQNPNEGFQNIRGSMTWKKGRTRMHRTIVPTS